MLPASANSVLLTKFQVSGTFAVLRHLRLNYVLLPCVPPDEVVIGQNNHLAAFVND